MLTNPPTQERAPFTSSKKLDYVAWTALAATIVAMVTAFVKSLADGDLVGIATTAFLVVIATWVTVLLARRHSPCELPRTEVFRPFGPFDITNIWDRPADTQRVVEAIHDSGETLPLVVGPSGAGKSTLLTVMVKAQMTSTNYEVINEGYEGLRAKFAQRIPDPDLDRETVIVLDQFEQWLAYVEHQNDATIRADEQEWLKATLNEIQRQSNCTVLISVRREWYYNLRFLGKLIPPPGDACDIENPKTASMSNEMLQGMLSSFNQVVKSRETASALLDRIGTEGRLSPLEVQLVGAFVETRIKEGKSFSLTYFDNKLDGVEGAIDAYFEAILNGAERPGLCMKILCALSLKTRFREQTALQDIRAGLYERTEAITNATEYLAWSGLVVDRGGGSYELAHDFLAEWFGSKSGTEVHPVERDNILAHINSDESDESHVLTPEEREEEGRIRWGLVAIVTLLTLMALRLLYFGLNCTLWGPDLAHPVADPFIDATYILIVAPYTAWIVYVSLFYDRVLIYLKEPPKAHLFSILIVANLIVSTLLGIFIPIAWLLGITTGGLAFAVKLIRLSRRPDVNQAAQQRLRSYGRMTLFNLLFVGVAGIVAIYAGIRYVQGDDHLGTWLAANLAASALMTYWCLILIPHHVSRSGVAQLLGLIGRPNKVSLVHADP